MTGLVNINVAVTGLPVGEVVNLQTILANPVGEVLSQNLALGANTIAVPTGTRYVLIQPPPLNTTNITLKGITGDTGVLLDPTAPTLFTVGTGVVSFVLTAGALITGVFIAFY